MSLSLMRVGGRKGLRRGLLLGGVVLACFVVGVAGGSLTVNLLPDALKQELGRYLAGSFSRFGAGADVSGAEVFGHALAHNLKVAGLMWLAGFTVLGIPVLLVLPLLRGFLVGFTVGFLVYHWGWSGVLIALAAVAVPNLLAVPALLALAVAGLAHALRPLAGPPTGGRRFGSETAAYSLFAATMALLLIVASLLEGYLAPLLLHALAAKI